MFEILEATEIDGILQCAGQAIMILWCPDNDALSVTEHRTKDLHALRVRFKVVSAIAKGESCIGNIDELDGGPVLLCPTQSREYRRLSSRRSAHTSANAENPGCHAYFVSV